MTSSLSFQTKYFKALVKYLNAYRLCHATSAIIITEPEGKVIISLIYIARVGMT